ncbi:MAG: FAD-binding oxidoreductase [Hasllibacter sp.]
MPLLDELRADLGPDHVLTGAAAAPYATDWTGAYRGAPAAVARPATTAQVAAVLRRAHAAGTPVVPVSGNTGLAGGAMAPEGAVMLSLARMNAIREVRPDARVAVAEAGVVLSALHEAADAHGLVFPLTFGAKGSAMVGGVLSTNAGGSNVLRYGSTRALCLGIEAVLADGRVLDLMGAVHKDNTGYDLKDLLIGAEGTLGIITAATLKLVSKPRAYATATVAAPTVRDALTLLHRLQDATGGAVECFEYMPRHYVEQHIAHMGGAEPFDRPHEVNLLVEVGATAPRDADAGPDGTVPVQEMLAATLADMLERGEVLDAVVATSEAQRRAMWARREAAGELMLHVGRLLNLDVALPLDRVQDFLERAEAGRRRIDPGARLSIVSHLGDGNVHWTVCPTDPALDEPLTEMVEDAVAALGGSFSAEHGIGLAKRGTMARRKDAVALDAMRAIKAALDPKGILNPGKVIPD